MNKTFLLIIAICLAKMMICATPPLPTRDQIANDLIGETLSEGYKDCWFGSSWLWRVEKGEIKALQIVKVLIKTTTDYCVIAKVRLQSEVNAFDAKLKINYQLKGKRWQFEYVVSLGMDIVKTGKYKNFLSIEID